ncbi:MAG: 4'-phosphopantetheinyl transferase superfamily protein [Alphaproteobacteria bacterium]
MITLTTIPSGSESANQLIAKWAIAEDHAQAELRQSETRRHDFLLTRSALRALLHYTTGVSAWHIRPDSAGKPYATSLTGKSGPHISLSHTKGLVACAISQEAPIGIDVEYWRTRDFTALANYAFSLQEREQVARDGKPAFYRIWTLKEAMAKATGTGILATVKKEAYAVDTQVDGFKETATWQLYCTMPTPNYSLAIATKGQSPWSEKSLACLNAVIEN